MQKTRIQKTCWILFFALASTPLIAQENHQSSADQAQDGTVAGDEPRWQIEFASSPHVVREEEDFLSLRYNTDTWKYEAQVGTVGQQFREQNNQAGISARRGFGSNDLQTTLRFTDKENGEDIVGGLRWDRSLSGGGAFTVDLTFAQADLASDLYVLSDSETQLAFRGSWQSAKGFEVYVTAADKADYDLERGTRELLRLLRRTRIGGAETLADLTLDEERLEDSVGAGIAFSRGLVDVDAYFKTGEQTLRGIPVPDDLVGFGAHVRIGNDRWHLRTELDVRELETVDAFNFSRGRLLIDFAQHIGRWEWGVGSYLQGEADSLTGVADLYETAGVALKLNRKLKNERRIGFWTMIEDNSPDFQKMLRVAFFMEKDDWQYGGGVRRDEVGRVRFLEETFGPFVFGRIPLKNRYLEGHIGIQDSEAYGMISLSLRR